MVQARSPCGAEWVRESRPEQSQDRVGGAGTPPLQGGARSLAATPVARQSGDPARTGSNEGGTAERCLRLRPFWDGGFLCLARFAVVRRQR